MHSRPCHALMSEPFSMILFENKHNTWGLRSILLKHRCKSSFIQIYTKIKICVFIAVKYMMGWSPRCYIPSFVKSACRFRRRRFLKVFFIIYGRGGHLGHVTQMPRTNVCSPNPRRLHIKFGFDRPSGFGEEDF